MEYETLASNQQLRCIRKMVQRSGEKISEEFTRQTESRSIRIPIGLINRSIRPMVFSFRRSKASVELDTRHFRGDPRRQRFSLMLFLPCFFAPHSWLGREYWFTRVPEFGGPGN